MGGKTSLSPPKVHIHITISEHSLIRSIIEGMQTNRPAKAIPADRFPVPQCPDRHKWTDLCNSRSNCQMCCNRQRPHCRWPSLAVDLCMGLMRSCIGTNTSTDPLSIVYNLNKWNNLNRPSREWHEEIGWIGVVRHCHVLYCLSEFATVISECVHLQNWKKPTRL